MELQLTTSEARNLKCLQCGEPLWNESEETLEEFVARLQHRHNLTPGVNVDSLALFCSYRCADEWHGYDPD